MQKPAKQCLRCLKTKDYDCLPYCYSCDQKYKDLKAYSKAEQEKALKAQQRKEASLERKKRLGKYLKRYKSFATSEESDS